MNLLKMEVVRKKRCTRAQTSLCNPNIIDQQRRRFNWTTISPKFPRHLVIYGREAICGSPYLNMLYALVSRQ
jgi:hypothetical protein